MWYDSHRAGGAEAELCVHTQKQMGDLVSIHCPCKLLLYNHTTGPWEFLCSLCGEAQKATCLGSGSCDSVLHLGLLFFRLHWDLMFRGGLWLGHWINSW